MEEQYPQDYLFKKRGLQILGYRLIDATHKVKDPSLCFKFASKKDRDETFEKMITYAKKENILVNDHP